ncbi:MAG: alpha/beta hydrolase [Stappiaceae bacterium]
MELVDLPDNPIPEGAKVGTVTTPDNKILRYARWPANTSPIRGTVTVLQGRTESIEKYFEVIRDLRERGFAVVTFDWRGQGRSSRHLRNSRKGHVRTFREYIVDLDAVFTEIVLPDSPSPHYALAHSTGGTVMMLAAKKYLLRFDRVALASPFLGFGKIGVSPKLLGTVAAVLSAVGFGGANIPGASKTDYLDDRFEGNPLTSDAVRFERSRSVLREARDLVIGAPTIGWLHAASRALDVFADPEFGPDIRLPMLIVAGGADEVVSSAVSESLASRMPMTNYIELAGGRHELLLERDFIREQFWAAFDAFIPAR